MRSTRSAEAIDRYIAKGADEETYEPRFTYHGFRYAKIEGYPGDLTAGDVTGKAVHTNFQKQASFACSNEDLNKVQHASEWTLRSNIHSLPTDCPQRDERLGWTGDGHMSVHADLYNFDAVRLYEKWLRDHAVNQFPSGNMSDTVPHGWGGRDADPNRAKTRVTVAWALYQHTGDKRVLETHYEGMKAYVDYWYEQANDHIVPAGKSHYGDHLSPDGRFAAPRALMNTFALYQTTEQVAKAAAELGRTADATEPDRLNMRDMTVHGNASGNLVFAEGNDVRLATPTSRRWRASRRRTTVSVGREERANDPGQTRGRSVISWPTLTPTATEPVYT